MDLDTLIVTVFCLVDDALSAELAGERLRQRGPRPTLSDSEVLTMEIVGEYLGLDQERQMFDYFRRHYPHFFPALCSLHRTTFTRQAANLWQIKARLWRQLLRRLELDRQLSLIDSFPIPVCRFARARRRRRLREVSAYGFDEMAKQTCFGVRLHLRVCRPGLVVGFEVAPANVHELRAAADLLAGVRGRALGDRNYWSPALAEQLRAEGLRLLAPFRKASRERQPWPWRLVNTRRRIETVIGQLVGRFHTRQGTRGNPFTLRLAADFPQYERAWCEIALDKPEARATETCDDLLCALRLQDAVATLGLAQRYRKISGHRSDIFARR